jgi:hypothetical protein
MSTRIATASAMSPMIVNAKPMATASAIMNVTNNDRVRGIDHTIRLKRQCPCLLATVLTPEFGSRPARVEAFVRELFGTLAAAYADGHAGSARAS